MGKQSRAINQSGEISLSVVILILRWLSVPTVFVAVMGICILLATSVVAATEGGCDNMVGGTCVEGWHTTVVEWSTYIGLAVAFLTAPFLTSKIAPALKRTTAVSAGVLGNVPIWFGYFASGWGDLLLPACVAALSSIISIWLVCRQHVVLAVKESQG